MAKKLEFFYDCSSPWTYLAFTKIEEVAARHQANLVWRPILVGGLFNTVNPSVYESREKPVKVKARYYTKDLQDWANFYKIKIGNPTVFPVNSVKAMRGAFVAHERQKISAALCQVEESDRQPALAELRKRIIAAQAIKDAPARRKMLEGVEAQGTESF